MSRPLRVVQLGLGPIGRACVRGAMERGGLRVVGAVDPEPSLAGRDLGRVSGLRRDLRVPVDPVPDRVLRRPPDLALHTTVSSLVDALPQIAPFLEAGVNVVSSTEEMCYPWRSRPGVARRLDRMARSGGASVHGTGVNPGFAMDVLALVLSRAALEVRGLRLIRVQDAATRRLQLRLKVGAGISRAAFRRRAREGSIGHVGLRESMDLIAAGLGWELESYEHRLSPVVAPRDLPGPPPVKRGGVAGQREVLWGFRDGREAIRMELVIALGAGEPRDEVQLRGRPNLTLRIEGGTPGDVATAAALLNVAPHVAAASPGLRTALDLPLPRRAAS
ncbi:MAG: dihydrodipicolinate reductase [Acidobacteriota bacterium]